MRLLDIEFKRSIQDIPSEAFEDLRKSIYDARLEQPADKKVTSLDTDWLKKAVDAVRKKYGLEPTTEIDDDKAIQAIDDPIKQEYVAKLRCDSSGKKIPVRRISKDALEQIVNKEERMRVVGKYLASLDGLSVEELEKLSLDLYDENVKKEKEFSRDTRRDIDPKYGINYFDKCFAIDHAKAVLVLKSCFSKGTPEEFRKKRDAIEQRTNRDGDAYYDEWYGEKSFVGQVLGISETSGVLSEMSMADVAEAIENRERELKQERGVTMDSIFGSAFKTRITRDGMNNSRRKESALRGQDKINDGVTKDE